MLRKIRIVFALIFLLGVTVLFLDFTGVTHQWLGWMAKMQFLPAVLSLNVVVVVALLLFTWLFGRLYCSVICPLGVFQDIFARLGGMFKKNRYSYSPEKRWLRYGVLVLFVISLLAGVSAIVALLAPYSAYGRICSSLFAPVGYYINNMLAQWAERNESYDFYSVDVWMKSVTALVVAITTVVVLVVLALRSGRTYCNTICPVGTLLGLVSRYSLFRPVIDVSKCNGCSRCARNCKASCIDSKSHTIDYSRCVACFDCIDNCKQGAISYKRRSKEPVAKSAEAKESCNESRRTFLTMSAILAATPIINARRKRHRQMEQIQGKAVVERTTRIVPPGALSIRNMERHCTACQLCISACPNQVLRPSQELSTLLQPEVSYERGYCRPECVRCSEVCPTGAIKPITVAEKSSIQVGYAVWNGESCLRTTKGVNCNSCYRHCPVGAIQLVAMDANDPNSMKVPTVDTERCIGCGACENLCPVSPISAIYVEGNLNHRNV